MLPTGVLQELANYSTLIIAIAMINVVWQLEKASKLLRSMSLILADLTQNETR